MIEKLIFRALLSIPKKIISFVIYPFIYPFRKKVWRSTKANKGDWQLFWVKQFNKGWKLFVWFFLDDSIHAETDKEYNTHKNNLYKYGIKNDFLNSWYWSGWRNASNNLSHWLAKGRFIKVLKAYVGKHYLYEIRQFEKGVYPYLEIYIGNKVINVGWLHSGKFEGPKIRKLSNWLHYSYTF